jgi:hypothetical protein
MHNGGLLVAGRCLPRVPCKEDSREGLGNPSKVDVEEPADSDDAENETELSIVELDRLWLVELLVLVDETDAETLSTGVSAQTLSQVDPNPVINRGI